MPWQKIDEATAPVDRPVLVRTTDDQKPVVAFQTTDRVWYSGGALVQTSTTVLSATPTEWCEPDGKDRL
jgi:hypothetical protein